MGQLKPDTFPDSTQNYNKTIVQPCEAQGGTLSGYVCIVVPPPPPTPVYTPTPVTQAPVASAVGSLTGSIGYSLAGGNCVDMAIAYGKNQPGNPIAWSATSGTPWIGAAALFPYNHVAIVVGIWSNGDIEVAQENSPGMPHRLPASAFRGFF